MDMHEVASKVQTSRGAASLRGRIRRGPGCLQAGAAPHHAGRGRERGNARDALSIQQKHYSLHRQRTLLDARNELPVATLRLSMFNRTPTYSAYPRTEHEETPCAFKFTADDTTVRSEFTDLVGGQHCTIGCDPSTDGSDSLNFWLVRGSGEAADVQQTIARSPTRIRAPRPRKVRASWWIAPGVDRMMMILICIGLLDEGFEDEQRSNSSAGSAALPPVICPLEINNIAWGHPSSPAAK
ncbi:hypothetical protein GQ600_21656 [Phytophthora cactorum]|nr:hypothetical protein GQ600_21656 [Phytophthora cactorum]